MVGRRQFCTRQERKKDTWVANWEKTGQKHNQGQTLYVEGERDELGIQEQGKICGFCENPVQVLASLQFFPGDQGNCLAVCMSQVACVTLGGIAVEVVVVLR
jgi:hypothetical protein